MLNLNLVDTVYKFDPIKNEWFTCERMPTKRAFHTSLHLTSSNGEHDLIFLFYGLHYKSSSSSSTDHSGTARLTQCFHVDYYNINTNTWSTMSLTPTLNHHIFYLYNNQLNRVSQQPSESIPDSTLMQFQVSLSRLITSVKSLLYILNENYVRCYEFDAAQNQLNALPYFQPSINSANNFVISATSVVTSTTAVLNTKSASFGGGSSSSSSNGSGSEPSINAMLFTWYSQTNSEDSSQASSLSTSELSSPTIVASNENDLEMGDGDCAAESEVVETRLFVKEALIYLFDTQNSILYEFYPAKNKLKKLPPLICKHNLDSSVNTMILNIKSKVYVFGAVVRNGTMNDVSNSSPTAVEVFDADTNTWSVFINKLEDVLDLTAPMLIQTSQAESENEARIEIPLLKHFFKLKMSLF